MTRKDYVALAEALAQARPPGGHGVYGRGAVWTWVQCMDAIAAVCAKDNPHFDRQRFLNACQDAGALEYGK